MTEQEIRIECLRLAALPQAGGHPDAVVCRARAYADFVLGTHDGEIISAARVLAGKVRDATE